MEKKLAEYRAKKQREKKINEMREKAKSMWDGFWKKREKEVEEPLVPPEDSTPEEVSSEHSDDDSPNCCTLTDFFYYLLWFVLWVILYAIFIEYQFGTVFLIVSALIFMFVNTRTGPKKSNEVSAYSVFNKNCESIDGTLKAEQFEREIRYGGTGL